jgi:hypothetical protein
MHRRIVLLAIALVAVAAATAASAAAASAASPAAAPTPTILTVSAQSTSVNWGAQAVVNGVLQTTVEPVQPVDQQQVRVEFSPSSIGPWTLAATVTNEDEPYTSGAYTHNWTANRTYYWRMNFPGTAEWAPYVGNVVLVKVKAVVGKPSCPSSVKAGKQVTVSGSLKPKFPAGSKTVTVKAQRYVSGKWNAYKSYKATNANSGSFSKYSVKIKITKKGKYRFYGVTADTTTLAAGKSAYSRTIKVK